MASEGESQTKMTRKEAGDFCARRLSFKDKKMLAMATHTCEACTWEVEAEGSGISGHLWLQREFKTSLDYPRLNQRKKRKKEKEEKDFGIQGCPCLLHCINASLPTREVQRGHGYPGSVVLTTYIPNIDQRGC